MLPAKPIKDPAPINPVHRSLIVIYLLALERAVPEIPREKPQAICPNNTAVNTRR